MKIPLVFFLALSLVTFQGYAQQNLFNIPAGDATPKGKFFFQHQINFYSFTSLEAKNHLVYGVTNTWEVGFNVVNLKMNWGHRQQNVEFLTTNSLDKKLIIKPLVQFTSQKFFQLTPHLKTSVGTQIGFNPLVLANKPYLTHFTYNTWMYEPRRHVKFVVGPYLSDFRTVGAGNRLGILLGFELPLHHKLLLMGDFISGNNATAVSVIGFNYLLTKRVQLCLGGMIPNPGSPNKAGVVFELNLLGFDDH